VIKAFGKKAKAFGKKASLILTKKASVRWNEGLSGSCHPPLGREGGLGG